MHPHDPCQCAICSLQLDFELDQHLIEEIEKTNCVIFAGAGISTETRGAHPNSLYDTLRSVTKLDGNEDFWEVVDEFERQPNGRQKLIQVVTERFDYIESFRDLRFMATRFHRSLSNAPYFQTIITTNWDRYFEKMTGGTPFVYDSDMPFWEAANRPVLKIHGSIDNFSSLVASSEDYEICESRLREGPLGAALKQIFATKTCIFCGFSARDKDFRSIFSTIKSSLGRFHRTHYLVSPFLSQSEVEELKNIGIIAIKTDATHFIEVVKSHMSEKFCFAKDSSVEKISGIMESFFKMHTDFVASYNPKLEPHLIYATAYQDGVIHALERIVDRFYTGEYSDLHSVQSRISSYEKIRNQRLKDKNYWDFSYFSGYQNGLMAFVIANDAEESDFLGPPECFHPGIGELNLQEFDDLVRKNPDIHKAAYRAAKRITERLDPNAGLVVQHLPF